MASTIIYSIYKATNTITGKVYIGYTSNEIQERIIQHKYDSKRIKSKFYNSINKHGWNSFEWEIIYQSWDENYCKNEMESFFITEHNSYHDGYNSTQGGDGANSEDVSKRMKTMWKDPNSAFNTVKFRNYIIEKNKKLYSKEYFITEPNGNSFVIKNLRDFCRNAALDHSGMVKVAKGVNSNCKGYQCRYLHEKDKQVYHKKCGKT